MSPALAEALVSAGAVAGAWALGWLLAVAPGWWKERRRAVR